uniref:Uncharacterized protein n=1 Tax=Strigamia maritima TaxID=126957 RepID=T1IH81_STRMM
MAHYGLYGCCTCRFESLKSVLKPRQLDLANMISLGLFCLILITNAQAEIPEAPFANFTPLIKETAGHCNLIEGIKVGKNKAQYEGRWYGIYMGMTKEKMAGITCLVWDTFFDEFDQFHNFLHLKENGTVKVLNDIGIPLDEKKGIYEYYYNAENSKSFLINTFFYIDDEVYFWWEEECIQNKNIKHHKRISQV